jgi:hypothetical protein
VNYGTLIPLENNFIKFYLIDFLFYLGFMLLAKGFLLKRKKLIILSSWFVFLEFLQIFFDIGTFDLLDVLMILLSLAIVDNVPKLIKKNL